MVQSVGRAIDILETLAESGRRLRLSEVAEATGLKANTTHNLMSTLVEREYVEKVKGPAYHLGEGAVHLAQTSKTNRLLMAGETVMESLYGDFPGATQVLSERIGGNIVVRLRMSPARPGVAQKPAGMTFHPYANASGLALLAFLPPEESTKVRQRYPFHEHGAHLWGSVEDLEEFLCETREKGYCIPPFEDQVTFRVAAPVMDSWDNPSFVLGASLPTPDNAEVSENLVEALCQAAEELSI